MSGKLHEWCVLIMKKFDYPMPTDGRKELIVSSRTAAGAAMKANNIIKRENPTWKIKSIWWLDPKRVKRER